MTIPRALPASLTAALPGIHWSLDTEGPPLYFQSLEQLKQIRRSDDTIIKSEDDLFADFLRDIPGNTETMFPIHDTDPEIRHFGLISLGLILLGHGFTDECHNLITPLSWPDDIHFAHGPSQYHVASPAAQAYSSYVHSLVHRKEGFHHGEFGMMGFSNANYWSTATTRSAGVDALPHHSLYERVRELTQEYSQIDQTVKEWFLEHEASMFGTVASTVDPSGSSSSRRLFDNRAVHQLCQQVLAPASQNPVAVGNNLKMFAERLAEAEIRILLWESLQKAGFTLDAQQASLILPWTQRQEDHTKPLIYKNSQHHSDEETMNRTAPPEECKVGRVVNDGIALTATRKLSSAHLDLFRSDGSVILRQVIPLDDPMSAAAGLACRLLESQACRLVKDGKVTHDNAVEIVLLDTDLDMVDMMARRPGSDALSERESMFIFESVSVDDPSKSFVDPLFGAKGETPTSVLQWSKGTIH